MKKYIFFLFLLMSFASCVKESDTTDFVDDYEVIDDENDLTAYELNDSNELEERTSTALKIDSLTLWNEFAPFKRVKAETYQRFANYFILHAANAADGSNNEGLSVRINGKNFGTNQGSSTVQAYITGKPYPRIQVNTWTNDFIDVTIDSLPNVKNVVLKLTVTVNGKTKSKTARCVGSNMTIGGTGSGTTRTYIHFPLSMWEINEQMRLFNRTLQGNEGVIDANYKPRVFDIVRRTISGKIPKTWEYQFGMIMSVGAPNSAGFQKVKIRERNRLGTGRVESATWLYKNGVFTFKDLPNFNDFIR